MVNRFETYFLAYYAYFNTKLHHFKTLGLFENFVFLIMSTRTVGLEQRAPPNVQQQNGDIRIGENLNNHSLDKTHIQT